MQWSALSGFMQDLSLMVIDEGQQYGTDREIATISLLKQQPLILWTGDAQQTPGGIACVQPPMLSVPGDCCWPNGTASEVIGPTLCRPTLLKP